MALVRVLCAILISTSLSKEILDSDGDGVVDSVDTDDNNDGILDVIDNDDDGDGVFDFREDDDGDGLSNFGKNKIIFILYVQMMMTMMEMAFWMGKKTTMGME